MADHPGRDQAEQPGGDEGHRSRRTRSASRRRRRRRRGAELVRGEDPGEDAPRLAPEDVGRQRAPSAAPSRPSRGRRRRRRAPGRRSGAPRRRAGGAAKPAQAVVPESSQRLSKRSVSQPEPVVPTMSKTPITASSSPPPRGMPCSIEAGIRCVPIRPLVLAPQMKKLPARAGSRECARRAQAWRPRRTGCRAGGGGAAVSPRRRLQTDVLGPVADQERHERRRPRRDDRRRYRPSASRGRHDAGQERQEDQLPGRAGAVRTPATRPRRARRTSGWRPWPRPSRHRAGPSPTTRPQSR